MKISATNAASKYGSTVSPCGIRLANSKDRFMARRSHSNSVQHARHRVVAENAPGEILPYPSRRNGRT
jgi:hypothetical protein